MSFGDPNENPYSPPPQQPPGQGFPPPPPNQPGYGYPQGPQNPPAYGYPQQPAYPGYPGGYPGANMMYQSMPGLLVTARVFLFIISAVQIVGALGYLYVAAIVEDIADTAEDFGLSAFGDDVDTVKTAVILVAVFLAALATLSIALGVKFSKGAQGVRITTVIYGALGTIVGLIGLFYALDSGMATAAIFPVLWVVFGAIITAAPVVPSGSAWFSRPRY